jgi:retinol dehydrogenase-12
MRHYHFRSLRNKGAATSVFLASSVEVADISGKYFSRGEQKRVKTKLNTQANRDRLWDLSMETLRRGSTR